jgi:hypothetical protein
LLEDAYEPVEEFKGQLKNTTVERKLTCFQIVLSLQAPKNTKVAGYQAPLPVAEVNPSLGPDDYSAQTKQGQRRPRKDDDEKPKPKTASGATPGQEETKEGARKRKRHRPRKPKNPDGAEGQKSEPKSTAEGGQKLTQQRTPGAEVVQRQHREGGDRGGRDGEQRRRPPRTEA